MQLQLRRALFDSEDSMQMEGQHTRFHFNHFIQTELISCLLQMAISSCKTSLKDRLGHIKDTDSATMLKIFRVLCCNIIECWTKPLSTECICMTSTLTVTAAQLYVYTTCSKIKLSLVKRGWNREGLLYLGSCCCIQGNCWQAAFECLLLMNVGAR